MEMVLVMVVVKNSVLTLDKDGLIIVMILIQIVLVTTLTPVVSVMVMMECVQDVQTLRHLMLTV